MQQDIHIYRVVHNKICPSPSNDTQGDLVCLVHESSPRGALTQKF